MNTEDVNNEDLSLAVKADPAPETDDQAIARLAALPAIEYERVRDAEAKKLGCRAATLDKLVLAVRKEQ